MKKNTAKQPKQYTHAPVGGETLPFPPFGDGVSFTPDQVTKTAEHLLAIAGWVPVDRVTPVVSEFLELAGDAEGCIDCDTGEIILKGDVELAGQYALLAARLINSYNLTVATDDRV